jgi:hypothetical protein
MELSTCECVVTNLSQWRDSYVTIVAFQIQEQFKIAHEIAIYLHGKN